MNEVQRRAIEALKGVTGYRELVAGLKAVKAAGIALRVKLNACKRALSDEVKRLLASVKVVASKISKVCAIASLTFAHSIKPLNDRAARGAIALERKLFH